MKEVKKCSISGIAFTLDADAYALLSRYLDSLKATYAETADGDEIVADIEARIAELILSQQENSRVVETPLLRQIISQMGTAEDISSESETDAAKKQPRIPRRLYRDTENARLGGVCAGLGRYFDVDATWVRLTLFAPLLLLILVEVLPFSGTLSTFFSNLFGVFVLGYFIMWFAVPAARSARQKLEMEGESITVRSIREKTVRDCETNSDVKSIVARVIYALGQLALIVIKIFIGFFIFGLTFAAPMPMPSESIILGVGAVTKTPVWSDEVEAFIPISKANIVATGDHRVVDGADIGRVLKRVAELLQRPEYL